MFGLQIKVFVLFDVDLAEALYPFCSKATWPIKVQRTRLKAALEIGSSKLALKKAFSYNKKCVSYLLLLAYF